MKNALQKFLLALLILLLLAAAGFIWWAETPLQPRENALTALQSDTVVQVIQYPNYITFEPVGKTPTTGFIFYPGGRVDFRAYAPILRQIAAQGYFVVLTRVKLNLAFFDVEAGAPALTAFPQITHWVTGGHSLGGVASAYFADNHRQEIRGIVFWASYPADDRLKDSDVKMLSIYATEDGLNNAETIEAYKAFHSPDTQFIFIQGGNHAQFGDYGAQPGDNPATISQESQWQQVADTTVQFLALWQSSPPTYSNQ